ncbi:MAG: hypothetical protein AAF495_01850 [Pseudomonadota bacterium]
MSELVKDMALTEADFRRLIPKALDGWDYRMEGTKVEAGTAERGIAISLSPLPTRTLGGLLKLERHRVEIAFRGLEKPEQEGFLRQFDQAFQRGGG